MPDPRPGGLGRWLLPISSIALSVAFLGLGVALLYRRVDLDDINRILLGLDKTWLALAMVSYWLANVINSVRFMLVARWLAPLGAPLALSIAFIFRMVCVAGFIAVVAPIGLVSDVAKVGALRLSGSMSITSAARATLFDRVVPVQCMGVFGFICAAFQASRGVSAQVIGVQLLLFFGIAVGVLLLLALPHLLHWLRIALVSRVARMFEGYHLMLVPDRVLIQLAITFLGALSVWATLYCLIRAAHLEADWWLVASFVPFLQIINSVPFLYLGWGGRELAMAATLGTVGGLSLNETLAISAAWGMTLLVTGGVNGVFLLGGWRSGERSRPPG